MTQRQKELVLFVRRFRYLEGYSPTLQEIGNAHGVNKTTVIEQVDSLVRQGILRRDRNMARSMTLTNFGESQLPPMDRTVLRWPVLGAISRSGIEAA